MISRSPFFLWHRVGNSQSGKGCPQSRTVRPVVARSPDPATPLTEGLRFSQKRRPAVISRGGSGDRVTTGNRFRGQSIRRCPEHFATVSIGFLLLTMTKTVRTAQCLRPVVHQTTGKLFGRVERSSAHDHQSLKHTRVPLIFRFVQRESLLRLPSQIESERLGVPTHHDLLGHHYAHFERINWRNTT